MATPSSKVASLGGSTVTNTMTSSLSKLLDASQRRQQSLVLVVAVLVLLRSKIPTRLPSLRTVRSQVYGRERLSEKELAQARQEVYRPKEDGTTDLLVPFRGRVSTINIKPTSAETFAETKKRFPLVAALKKGRASVDAVFMRQLSAVLSLIFPHWRSKEVGLVGIHSFFLVVRTLLSVLNARLDGRIVRDLVSKDLAGFAKGIGLWFALAVPSSYTNSMLKHLQSKLSLTFRTRLTRYIHDLYLTSAPYLRYYRVGHEGGLEGVDQYITYDVNAFCDSLASLYGNVMKPLLDMLIFNVQLSYSLGLRGNMLLWVSYFSTAILLRSVTPAFARLAAIEAKLEGEYRGGVARAGREAEEIAFYSGGPRERGIIENAYKKLMSHVNSIVKVRIAYEWTEDFVIKYFWSASGYMLISIPVMFARTRDAGVQANSKIATRLGAVENAVAQRTEDYISNRRLLLAIADAGGRLMYAYKDILELAGLTTRVYQLISTLHALPPVTDFTHEAGPTGEKPAALAGVPQITFEDLDIAVPARKVRGANVFEEGGGGNGAAAAEKEDVPESLMEPLTLTIKQGEHLMITGPNGVGKTAVARVLAGLWGYTRGSMGRPERGIKGVFVVPQRAYMVTGTLRDQIIYPHSYAQFVASGRTDEDLVEILHHVHLSYLPAREGGWTTQKEWKDVLSGGERQRMNMARLFYHRPQFGVLDECTSAVSTDVEGLMYQHAKDLGITLITISHRPSLIKYHTRLLTLKGDAEGSWSQTRVGDEEQSLSVEREIADIEAKLAEVPELEERLQTIADELGVSVKIPGKH